MTAEYVITLAQNGDTWDCVLQNQGQYSRFQKTTSNACLEEVRIRLNKRQKQNLMFPMSPILNATGGHIREAA